MGLPLFKGHNGSNDDLFDDPVKTAASNERNDGFKWGGHGRTQNPNWDPSDPSTGPKEYEGTSGAEEDVNRYRNMASTMNGRDAPVIDMTNARRDASMATDSRVLGMSDRGSQLQALDLQRRAALGQAPSAAAQQMQAGTNAAMASQMALAAGARGQAGIAQAGYQAAGNNAALNAQNTQQTGILRAQEMAQARGAYGDQSNSLRQGDAQQRQQDLMARGMSAQEAQAQADMEMRQRGLNQQGQSDFEHMGFDVNKAQLDANAGLENANIDRWRTQSGLDAGSTARAESNAAGFVSGGASLITGLGGSDVRMKENAKFEGIAKGMEMQFGSPGVAQKAANEVARDESRDSPAVAKAMQSGVADGNAGTIFRGDPYGKPSDLTFGTKGQHDTMTAFRKVGGAIADGARSFAAKFDTTPQTASSQMLDRLNPYSYNYKPGTPGEDPSRLRYGVMAQDLQKSPMGASMVEETPGGKMVDARKAAGVNLAALADLHQRVKRIEAKDPSAVASKVREDGFAYGGRR